MRQAPRRFDAGPGLVVRALISLRNQCLAITRKFPVTVQAGCRRITIPGDRGPAAILRIRRRGAGYGSLWTVAHEPYPFRRISYNEIRVHAFARGVRSWAYVSIPAIVLDKENRWTFRQHGRYETFP